jgi:hypothetical protein
MKDIIALKDIQRVVVFLVDGREIAFRLLDSLEIHTKTNEEEVLSRLIDESWPNPPRPPLRGEIDVAFVLNVEAAIVSMPTKNPPGTGRSSTRHVPLDKVLEICDQLEEWAETQNGKAIAREIRRAVMEIAQVTITQHEDKGRNI